MGEDLKTYHVTKEESKYKIKSRSPEGDGITETVEAEIPERAANEFFEVIGRDEVLGHVVVSIGEDTIHQSLEMGSVVEIKLVPVDIQISMKAMYDNKEVRK